jgi:hypothetical protein
LQASERFGSRLCSEATVIETGVELAGSDPAKMGTTNRFMALTVVTTNQRRTGMPKDAHSKAAEHHESAAKSHRSAAEHHGKGDHAKGREESARAHGHSKTAHEQSEMAHGKSQSQK